MRKETDLVDAHVLELHAEIKALRQELGALKGGDNG